MVHTSEHIQYIKDICKSGGGHIDIDTPVCKESFNIALKSAGAWLDGICELKNGKSVFDKRYKIVRGDCIPDVYDDICELVRVELNNSPWFHDFTNVLDGQGPFFIDGCHISDQGNAIVANNIGHFIKSNRENQVINR